MSHAKTSDVSKGLKAQKTAFGRRVQTLKNKARELSVLCEISVAVICYGPDGELHHWPERPGDVRRIAESYRGMSDENRRKRSLDLNAFLGSNKRPKPASRDSDESLDKRSDEELRFLLSRLDSKLVEFQERLSSKMGEPRGIFGPETDCTEGSDRGLANAETAPARGEKGVEVDVFGALDDLTCGSLGFGLPDAGFGHSLWEMELPDLKSFEECFVLDKQVD